MITLLTAILLVLIVGLSLLVGIGVAVLQEMARWKAEADADIAPLPPGSTRTGSDDMGVDDDWS